MQSDGDTPLWSSRGTTGHGEPGGTHRPREVRPTSFQGRLQQQQQHARAAWAPLMVGTARGQNPSLGTKLLLLGPLALSYLLAGAAAWVPLPCCSPPPDLWSHSLLYAVAPAAACRPLHLLADPP